MRSGDGEEDSKAGPTGSTRRDTLEREVRQLAADGRVSRAADMVLKVHGAELYGFLIAVLDDRRVAANVYADASRAMKRALGGATWTCSLRTFAYAVARRELARHRRLNPGKQQERRVETPNPESTMPRRPMGPSKAIAELRSRLADEDRELLILRVDRQLEWEDIAISLLGWDASREALASEVARVVTRVAEIRKQLGKAAAAHSSRGSS